MSIDMKEAFRALADDRGISIEALLGALADALESAYRRMPGAEDFSWVTIDFETMTFQIIQARAKFIIAWDVDEEGKETWTAITFYWMSRA